jgi:subtilisin family serine protease
VLDRTGDQPHLQTWWYDAMSLGTLHRQSTGRGVKIAVIDIAIDPAMPELKGAHLTLGRDCLGEPTKPGKGLQAEHGSVVTSLIIGTGHGTGPGGRGILGVAPDAEVTFYGADFDPKTDHIDCSSGVNDGLVTEALEDNPDIIVCSIGLGYDHEMRDDLDQAIRRGIVVVGAAGQKGRAYLPHFPMAVPAAHPGAVAVLAADKTGQAWTENPPPVLHSIVKGYPTITAPGVDVTASRFVPGQGWRSGVARTGTSYAAPLVAGVVALAMEKYPDASGNQLVQQLIHERNAPATYWSRYYGYGVLATAKFLAKDPTGWPDVNPLLHGPKRALSDFPASVYDDTPASTPAAPATPVADGADDASSVASGSDRQAAARFPASRLAPVAVGAGVVVLLGVGLVLLRRTRARRD